MNRSVLRFIRDLIDNRIALYLGWGGIGLITVTATYTFLSVLRRGIFGKPLPGDIEIPEVILPVAAAFFYTLTSVQGKHVMTDIALRRFSPYVRKALECVQILAAAVLFSIVTWQGAVHAVGSARVGAATDILEIAVPPFEFAYVAAMGLFSLHLFIKGISLTQALFKKG